MLEGGEQTGSRVGGAASEGGETVVRDVAAETLAEVAVECEAEAEAEAEASPVAKEVDTDAEGRRVSGGMVVRRVSQTSVSGVGDR